MKLTLVENSRDREFSLTSAVSDEETDVAEKQISLEYNTEFRFPIFPDDANR